MTVAERLMKYCAPIPEVGCWIWFGAARPNGRGQIWKNGRFEIAYRAAYEEFIGPIPSGLQVLHKCDVMECINPAHLFVGTQSDNIRDCVRKGRYVKNMKKLSDGQVAEILKRRANGETYHAIAASYGVTDQAIFYRCKQAK